MIMWRKLSDIDVTDLADDPGLAAILLALPPLPEPAGPGYDGPDALRDLILYRFSAGNLYLVERVTLADAQEYIDRDDTHDASDDPQWFVGRDLS